MRLILIMTILLACGAGLDALAAPAPGVSGTIVIAGNGPELSTIERLGRAFEKLHPGAVVDIEWDPSSDPIALVKSGAASFAVAGQAVPTLTATQIAWDGIVVVVYATHPMKDVTTDQLAAIFTGKIARWPDGNGRDTALHILNRPLNQNIRQQFEATLGIVGRIPAGTPIIPSDQDAISTVAGSFSAVAFASLNPALQALEYGVGVSLVSVDGVHPATETVRDGRYPLRRPVLLLSGTSVNALASVFAAFALSPEGQAIIEEVFTTSHAALRLQAISSVR